MLPGSALAGSARGRLAALAGGLLGLTAATGCGAPGLQGNIYRGDGFAFRVQPAGQWTPIDAEGAALAYRDEANHGTVLINARCGPDGDDVPLLALTNHLFLQFTDEQIEIQEVVSFDGREAMHTVMTAKLDGVLLSYDAWVLKKDDCVYDLVYAAPPSEFAGGRPAFAEMVGSFTTAVPNGD